MKVLVVGNGAREHALVWKIAQSNKVSKIYCAPGNGGISNIAQCVNINPGDVDTLLGFALKEGIDLTVVGPELPLVNGIVDKFNEKGLNIFGPNKKASMLEGSKTFSKRFMEKYDIPTARFKSYDNAQDAIGDLDNFDCPLVIKADGLAAGKGVVICNTYKEAEDTILQMIEKNKFGDAGKNIVIEEFLEGIEVSLLCFVDGKNIVPMESARDYKKALDGDKGLNTGGMGCFSPNPILNEGLTNRINKEILTKIMTGFNRENIEFKGVLFIGFMITEKGPKILEFNVRFGDPETEVVIPRLESDIIDIFTKVIDGNINSSDIKWSNKRTLCVIAASGGYPESYEKGKLVSGLDSLDDDILVFHGGTKNIDKDIYTNGGRVLAVTALGENLYEAREKAYKNIKKVKFQGIQYRNDIGKLD
ncbi:phosphoribosylamine--glycine ligase [Clostridiisalibacter paucivorans]|uniref:phosphoribosylamine--glycine ligase n=1 Tax=Clostridiisalibacter paucivorans TaxID=408753 RepID=UPI00047B4E93|nr:phosphoribosylamine--glycine ligase [Clostridiisalibacter paucivorans]